MKSILLLLLLPLSVPFQQQGVGSLAEAYRKEVIVARDVGRCSELCSEDVLWVDPTAAVWGIPLMDGISGSEVMAKTMADMGLSDVEFETSMRFTAGRFACLFGGFSGKGLASKMKDMPFMTVIEVKDGRISGRTDYGDYDVLMPHGKRTVEGDDSALVAISNDYLMAYADSDFDAMEGMLAENATFQDPTASAIGSGKQHKGAAVIVAQMRSAFASISNFTIDVKERFYFQNHAVFAAECGYSLAGRMFGVDQERVRFTHPLILVLEVKDEEVVSHLDYADYDTFAEQLKALQEDAR